MKILFLNQTFYPDVVSSAQHSADLAAHLAAAGHEVHAVAGTRAYDNPQRQFPRKEMWNGVRIHRVTSGRLGKSARWKRVADFTVFLLFLAWRLITLPRFDVVIAMTSPPLIGFIASVFVRLKGGRLVYWLMDLNPDQAIAAGCIGERSVPARAFGWMLAFTLRTSSCTVVLDRFMRQRVLARGARADSIAVIPPWPHDRAVQIDDEASRSFRRNHDLERKFVVMYSGNHSPCHPLRSLLDAALELRSNPDISFVFVGGGSEQPKVKGFAAEHHLENIRILPYQAIESLSASLGAANLHVVVMGDPFVGIVHPCKIYNILCHGIPVLYIGPETGHIPDMVGNCEPAWFRHANHGESSAIARHILAQARRAATQSGGPLRDLDEQKLAKRFGADLLISRMADVVTGIESGDEEAVNIAAA